MAVSLMWMLTACEVELGNPAVDSGSSSTAAPATGTPGKTGNTGNNNNNNGSDPDPGTGTAAPGVPSALSPGGGESFAGPGAKVTFVWTDAEGAEQFELVAQGLGAGGWQTAAHQVTDNFQYTYTFDNTDWSQYRWAVRSIGPDAQASDYTAWRSFTWTP
jgi:hypothetical protein